MKRKTAKRNVIKRDAVKRSTTKRNTIKKQVVRQKVLKKAPEAKSFITKDGDTISSVMELVDKLAHMQDSVFYHHVSSEKNDFSTWVENVFKEKAIAQDIRTADDKRDMQVAILRGLLKRR